MSLFNLQQCSYIWIECCFPQLFRIHFSQTLVTLNGKPLARLSQQPIEARCKVLCLAALVPPLEVAILIDQVIELITERSQREIFG